MSVRSYVMLDIEPGKISSVVEEVARIEEVKSAYPITGDHDAIIEIEVGKTGQLNELITQKIQSIKGVENTTTYIAFR